MHCHFQISVVSLKQLFQFSSTFQCDFQDICYAMSLKRTAVTLLCLYRSYLHSNVQRKPEEEQFSQGQNRLLKLLKKQCRILKSASNFRATVILTVSGNKDICSGLHHSSILLPDSQDQTSAFTFFRNLQRFETNFVN